MGYTHFLIGQNAPVPSSLPDAIKDLEDASTVFMIRWREGEMQRAGEVSKKAMVLLDFIVNELLREKDTRNGLDTYPRFRNSRAKCQFYAGSELLAHL